MRTLGKELIYSSHNINDLCTGWKMDSLLVEKEPGTVKVTVKGTYANKMNAEFRLIIFTDGTITSDYSLNGLPAENIREAGVRFILENDFDTLEWKRKPYWGAYPSGHLSAPEGKVPLFTASNKIYRTDPGKEWQEDKKSFFYDGINNETSDEMTNSARATKENIYEYSLSKNGSQCINVSGNGDVSCRIEKNNDKLYLNISNLVDYPDLSWGNYCRNIISSKSFSGKVKFRIKPLN